MSVFMAAVIVGMVMGIIGVVVAMAIIANLCRRGWGLAIFTTKKHNREAGYRKNEEV